MASTHTTHQQPTITLLSTNSCSKLNEYDIKYETLESYGISNVHNTLTDPHEFTMNDLQTLQQENHHHQHQHHQQHDTQQQTTNLLNTIDCMNYQHQEQDQQQEHQQQPIQNIMDLVQSQQVRTIIYNGQPAIFIPAPAAINSNLLSQMIMNSTNTSQLFEYLQTPNNQTQTSSTQQPHQLQIQQNDLNNLLASHQNHNNESNNITYIQLPANTDPSSILTSDNQILCKIEDDEFIYQLQQDNNIQFNIQQQQQQIDDTNSNLNINQTNVKIKKPRAPKNSNKPAKKPKLLNDNDTNSNNENHNVNISNADFSNFTVDNNGQVQSTDQTIQQILFLDGELNGQKRKRKACDCPNCLRWRQNEMTPEELNKKRTHKCHKCNKEYNKTSHLRAHLRAHDNYRPYVCDFKMCGKSFTRSDELKRHKRIHYDDRNFPCPICKKKFLRSDHLSKHLLVHNKVQNQQQQQQSQQPQQVLITLPHDTTNQTTTLIKLNSIE